MKVFNCFDERNLDSSRRYCEYPNVEDLNETDYLILAHATSSELFDSIISKGLLANSVTNIKVNDNLETDSDSVYLSAGEYKFYMRRAVKEFGGQGIVIVVKVDKSLIVADENSLSYGDKINPNLSQSEKLVRSMCLLGACKHLGNIPKDNIIKIYSQDGKIIYKKD